MKIWVDADACPTAIRDIICRAAERLGITTYKIGQTFPLDMRSFNDWADGLDLIVVVEEKRKLIEIQIKEAIFDDRQGRRVYDWYTGGAGGLHSEELFATRMAPAPAMAPMARPAKAMPVARETKPWTGAAVAESHPLSRSAAAAAWQ